MKIGTISIYPARYIRDSSCNLGAYETNYLTIMNIDEFSIYSYALEEGDRLRLANGQCAKCPDNCI
jgi:hypothetical protein